jgi:cell wall assembly regulator SMI1
MTNAGQPSKEKMMPELPKRTNEVWAQIAHEMERISPDIRSTLNPPAQMESILLLEEKLGVPLPEDFKSYLLTFNGQNEDGENFPLVGYNYFLSVEQIMKTMDTQMDNFGNNETVDFVNENKIKAVLWNRLWIPFSELNSQMLILDLDPAKNGKTGQVFQCWPGFDHERDDIVCAPSFALFSRELLRRLRADEFECEDGNLIFKKHGFDEEFWIV